MVFGYLEPQGASGLPETPICSSFLAMIFLLGIIKYYPTTKESVGNILQRADYAGCMSRGVVRQKEAVVAT